MQVKPVRQAGISYRRGERILLTVTLATEMRQEAHPRDYLGESV